MPKIRIHSGSFCCYTKQYTEIYSNLRQFIKTITLINQYKINKFSFGNILKIVISLW
jgi:hypothetical protein